MAGSLGNLLLTLQADTAKFTADIGRAAHLFEKNINGMRSALGGLRNALVGAVTVGGFVALVKSAIDAGDALDKVAQRTGVSVARLSELQFAARLAGVTLDDFASGMSNFNKSLVEAQDGSSKMGMAFKALGVDVRAGPEAALNQFLEAVARLPDGATKISLVREALGKAGDQWIPFINSAREGTETARRAGLVIGPEFARQAAQFNDNLTTMRAISGKFAVDIGSSVLPALITITTNINNATNATERWKTIFIEFNKIIAATAGALLPGMDQAVENYFRKMELLTRKSTVKSIRGPSGEPLMGAGGVAQGVPDTARLGRILSGLAEKDAKEAEARSKRLREEDLRGWIAHAEAVFEEADRLNLAMAKIWDEYWAHVEKMRQLDVAGWVAHAEEVFRQADELNLALARIADEEAQRAKEAARELGMTFTSAFEDAALAGKKLSDVLKGLAADVARIFFRRAVTEPLAGAVSGFAVDLMKGFFKRQGGGPVAAGRPYLVGERGPELFVPQSFGEIMPQAGGQSVQVVLNITAAMPDPRLGSNWIAANAPTIAEIVRREFNKRLSSTALG